MKTIFILLSLFIVFSCTSHQVNSSNKNVKTITDTLIIKDTVQVYTSVFDTIKVIDTVFISPALPYKLVVLDSSGWSAFRSSYVDSNIVKVFGIVSKVYYQKKGKYLIKYNNIIYEAKSYGANKGSVQKESSLSRKIFRVYGSDKL